MKLAIIGSRRRNSLKDFNKLKDFLMKAKNKFPTLEIISGGCEQGADHFAELICEEFQIPIKIFYPDKSKLPENPKRYHFTKINYERNKLIAENCDILVAMTAPDRTGGTENTISEAHKLWKKVILI